MFKKYSNNSKGFTLIELLVVITIIAILALAVLNRISGSKGAADISAAASDIQSFYQDALSYKIKNGKTDFSGIDATTVGWNTKKGPWNNTYTGTASGTNNLCYSISTNADTAQHATELNNWWTSKSGAGISSSVSGTTVTVQFCPQT